MTKAMHYRSVSIFLIFSCLSGNLFAQGFSEKRIFTKSFLVNIEMTLEIDNKYGTIHISSTDSDSLTIRTEVEASAPNQERTHKMLEGITIDISDTKYLVRAQTEFSQSVDMIFERFKGMTSKIIPYESRMQINYFINAPDYMNIRVVNKYGDVYIENSNGRFLIDLSNGSFKANSLSNNSDLTLNFCDATINEVSNCRIDVSFSDVFIGESENLEIKSASTKFDIKNTGSMNVQSRRDKFFINNIRNIRGISYFTEYRIENLDNEVNLETKYGSFEADNITKNCIKINITSGYTDLYLTFDKQLSYELNIRHTNAFLVLPEEKAHVEKEILNEEKKEYMTSGVIGRNQAILKVIIEANRGNIYLK
jgi:hypothetical protein